MTPAMLELLLALYRHAMAPSTANQDAVRAAGRAVEAEAAQKSAAAMPPHPTESE